MKARPFILFKLKDLVELIYLVLNGNRHWHEDNLFRYISTLSNFFGISNRTISVWFKLNYLLRSEDVAISRWIHDLENYATSGLIRNKLGYSWVHRKPSFDLRLSFSGFCSYFGSVDKIFGKLKIAEDPRKCSYSCWSRVSILYAMYPLWFHRFIKISFQFFWPSLFMPPDRMIGGILFLSCLSVCLFVCLFVCLSVVNFNFDITFEW